MGQDSPARDFAIDPAPHSTPEAESPGAALNAALHAMQGRFTNGISPIGPWLALLDWAAHIANSPGTWLDLWLQAASGGAAVPQPGDHRFSAPGWSDWPFSLFSQTFLSAEAIAARAAVAPPGLAPGHARMMQFGVRQLMDMFSPSNVACMNPEVLRVARESLGANFVAGLQNFLADMRAQTGGDAPPELLVGRDLAVTPGRVVLRNALMELIQYTPQTGEVRPEPLLIVPAWIMKYYILDLSPANSLVRYLVGQGFTVFVISWKNPDASMADMALDDYLRLGIGAAVDPISFICQDAKIHACGYCLGGTLAAIAAAAMTRDTDNRLASVTLLAAQTDFTEAGELQLFINEDQIAFLSDVVAARGFLDSSQMAGAFQMLRANDLIWSRAVRRYMLGVEEFPNDLMTWNADGTRMPARMHAEYLQHLFHDNDLAEGRLQAGGASVALGDIGAPLFVVGTESDHIAPWHSVYKIGLLNDGDLSFVLTSGGHNAGIVSEPGHAHRHFRLSHRERGGHHAAADSWMAQTAAQAGSWWPAWAAWLAEHSGPPGPPPPMGAPLGDAPGNYVLEH